MTACFQGCTRSMSITVAQSPTVAASVTADLPFLLQSSRCILYALEQLQSIQQFQLRPSHVTRGTQHVTQLEACTTSHS